MKQTGYFRDLGESFVRPFGPANWKRTLLGLLFCYLPFTRFIALGDAYSQAAGSRAGLGQRAKLGLKIIAAELLLGAPLLLVYGAVLLLAAYFAAVPLYVSLALLVLASILAVRFLVLAPIAACCLALGAPLRTAVSGREMKSVLSGCFWGYLLAALLHLLLLFVFNLLTIHLSLLMQLLLGGLITALTQYLSAGFYMSCCRKSLGLPRPPRQSGPPRGRAVVAVLLTLTLTFSLLPVPAYAARPLLIADMDLSGKGKEKTENSEFAKRLQDLANQDLNGKSPLDAYDLQERNKMIDRGTDLVLTVADVGLDFVPVIGNIKNAGQAIYYGYKGYNATSDEARQEAYINMSFKIAGLALNGVATGLKAAKAAGGIVFMKVAVSASKVEKAGKLVNAVKAGNDFYGATTGLVKGYDIVTGDNKSSKIDPNGIYTFVKKSFADDEFLPVSGHVVYSGGISYVVPPHGSSPARETLPPFPDELRPTEPIRETLPPFPDDLRPTESLIPPEAIREYWGYVDVPQINIPGTTCTIAKKDVLACVNADGTADFSYTLDITITVSYYGTGTKTHYSVLISQERIKPEIDTANQAYTYRFSKDLTADADMSYFGEGYGTSGSSKMTYSATYDVVFTVQRDPFQSESTGASVYYAPGLISITPAAEQNAMTILPFVCE